MNCYVELKKIVEAMGIRTSALALPTTAGTYAVIRMVTHIAEQCADDLPTVYGAYMQIDLFTDADLEIKATKIVNAALAVGYDYRGRSDDFTEGQQHAEIRLRKIGGTNT